MIGDGVESGFLSPYLISEGISKERVALLFTVYGVTASISAWFSGALSDLWGPRRVMLLGFGIWAALQVVLLGLALPAHHYWLIMVSYGLRGFGYPLFAYGFLVWVTAVTPRHRLGSAVGWFWFAFTGGLPTLGSLVASFTVPWLGTYRTLWFSLVLVVAGALIALLLVREPVGRSRLAPAGERPVATLLGSLSIVWRNPRIGTGAVVRTINTAAQFGFLVFLPVFFTVHAGLLPDRLAAAAVGDVRHQHLLQPALRPRRRPPGLAAHRRLVRRGGLRGDHAPALLRHRGLRRQLRPGHGAGEPVRGHPCRVRAAVRAHAVAGPGPQGAGDVGAQPRRRSQHLRGPGRGRALPRAPRVQGVMWIFAGLYLASAAMTLFLTLPEPAAPPRDTTAVPRAGQGGERQRSGEGVGVRKGCSGPAEGSAARRSAPLPVPEDRERRTRTPRCVRPARTGGPHRCQRKAASPQGRQWKT